MTVAVPVPEPKFEVLTVTLLFLTPVVVPVTVKLGSVQVVFAAIVPLVKMMLFAATVSTPPHCGEDSMSGTVSPAGMVSVKLTPLNASVGLLLAMAMVSVVVAPVLIAVGEKVLVTAGTLPTTKVAVAGLAFKPPLVTNAPAAMVLTFAPALVLVTVTLSVQLLLTGIVPPVSVTDPVV